MGPQPWERGVGHGSRADALMPRGFNGAAALGAAETPAILAKVGFVEFGFNGAAALGAAETPSRFTLQKQQFASAFARAPSSVFDRSP
jgi:hypothetical protein